ncbi:MAG: hypothetical protein ACOY5F_20060 [Pseudomonadota bacterium]
MTPQQSPDLPGGGGTQQGVELSTNFHGHRSRLFAPADDNRFHNLTQGFGRAAIAAGHALGRHRLQTAKLFFVPLDDGRVQEHRLGRRWLLSKFGFKVPALDSKGINAALPDCEVSALRKCKNLV